MISSLIKKLKGNNLRLPMWLGQVISYIPYSYRPIVGKQYKCTKNAIAEFDSMSSSEQQDLIFHKMYSIVDYAINNIPFYKDFYAAQGFTIDQLKSFEDIQRIPIIDKHILLKYSLKERSNESLPKFLVNTGGSSGYTLNFYVQPSSIANEWAHIHTMWGYLGFKPSDLRLFIAGRSVVKDGVDYEFARHTLSIDMYKPFAEIAPILKKKLKNHHCYFLHGYPSTLAEFAEYCRTDEELLSLLKPYLKGAFLSSEYPYPMYRDVIESVFNIPTQSFYGHTERCIMAYETSEKFKFVPFQTYGFAEAIPNSEGHFDLIGTSYYNQATPLIRYNTKDVVDNPIFKDGILQSFNIFEGRSGQFILDAKGNKISLTGLVMGRHHDLFDMSKHIQIGQSKQGEATIYYVPRNGVVIHDASQYFDYRNINIKFKFKQLDSPIRTISGKVNLLVQN